MPPAPAHPGPCRNIMLEVRWLLASFCCPCPQREHSHQSARILAPLEMMMGWLLAGGAKPGKVTYSLGLEKEGIRGHITGVVDGDTINVRIPL